MESIKKFRCFSGSTLKLIALAAMAIDHFAASILYYNILLPAVPISPDTWQWNVLILYQIMRVVGRIAFPIFAFLLVQGFLHTSNRSRYALRLLIFAVISEFPFDLALNVSVPDWAHQNVFFTLLIGLLVIWGMHTVWEKKLPLQMLLMAVIFLLGCLLARTLQTDYTYWGILLIAILYMFRSSQVLFTAAGCVSLLWEAPACLAFIPINMYNGKRGVSLKYFFYGFYPAHLLVLGILRYLLAS